MSELKAYRCGVEAMIDVAGGKWKPVILHYLRGGTKRFGELRTAIGDITQRSLTLQLRELEEHGVVRREVFAEVPPRVEYSLTEFGQTLTPVLQAMKDWGDAYKQRDANVADALPKRPSPAPAHSTAGHQ